MPLSTSEPDTTTQGGTPHPQPPSPIPQLSDTNNYYTYLKIAPSSTKQELSKIKRNLGLQHHPDRLVSAGGGEASASATAEFQKMMELIDVLLDDGRRLEHDTKCGINMNMRIDDILNRGQRLAGSSSSNNGSTGMMYVHPDTMKAASVNYNNYNGGGDGGAPSRGDDESDDDDEEYCPTPKATPSSMVATNTNKAAAVAEGSETVSDMPPPRCPPGNLSTFGVKEYTQDDINELGFKPRKVVPSASMYTHPHKEVGDDSSAHQQQSGGGLSCPILPPPGLIGVANDPSLGNTKAFESVGLKRERSPHLIRQQGTVEVDLEF